MVLLPVDRPHFTVFALSTMLMRLIASTFDYLIEITQFKGGPYVLQAIQRVPFAYPPIQRDPFAFCFLMAPAFSRLDGRTREPMRLNSSPVWRNM